MNKTVTKEMTIGEILDLHASMKTIMIGVGIPVIGPVDIKADTLSDVCAAHGLKADALADSFNRYLAKL